MNQQDINIVAVDYKKYRRDSDCVLLYKYVQKLTGILCREFNMKYDEDIAQDAVVKLITKINQFDEVQYTFVNWMYTIVKHSLLRKIERSKKWSVDVKVEESRQDSDIDRNYIKAVESFIPEYFAEEKLNDADIEYALATFDINTFNERSDSTVNADTRFEIYKESITTDHTLLEISLKYDINIQTIKNIIHRCKLKFLKHLHKEFPLKHFPVKEVGKRLKLSDKLV